MCVEVSFGVQILGRSLLRLPSLAHLRVGGSRGVCETCEKAPVRRF